MGAPASACLHRRGWGARPTLAGRRQPISTPLSAHSLPPQPAPPSANPTAGSAGRVAVIGSGLAGLAACWDLGAGSPVTLYEKQPQLGMAAHGLDWGGARVDMPLRVLYRGYYPTLTALYAEADIGVTSADYAACFCDAEGDSYFRYRNSRGLPGLSLPLPWRGHSHRRPGRRILADLLRLYAGAAAQARSLRQRPRRLQDWLREQGYSEDFREGFLLPAFAAIGTCDIDSVRDYPAATVLDYLRRGVLLKGVARTVQGADHVVARLASRASAVRTGCGVRALEPDAEGCWVEDEQGGREHYAHVVLATPGHHAHALVAQADPAAAAVLRRFAYQRGEVVVHTDPALMPRRRRDWSPVNFFVSAQAARPMASIWLNRVLPVAAGTADAFQTWAPLRSPQPASVLARAQFERPLIDAGSNAAIAELQALHAEPGRRLWYCGSYAEAGVPLLESAARSARQVAAAIRACR